MAILTQEQISEESEKAECFFELFAKDIETYKCYYQKITHYDDGIKSNNIMVEYTSFRPINQGVAYAIEYLKKELFDSVASDVYEPYLDTQMLFEEFLNSKSPILQFTGKPGLGKSKLITLLIKYLLSKEEYLTDEGVLEIARPTESGVLADDEF